MREQKAKAQAKKANYEKIPTPCPAHQNRDMNQNTPPLPTYAIPPLFITKISVPKEILFFFNY